MFCLEESRYRATALTGTLSSSGADEPTAAHTLDNLIDRRHGQVSTAVTSNIALGEPGRYLGDAILTVAILDRLAMHAIHIIGPSYRQRVARSRAERAPAT